MAKKQHKIRVDFRKNREQQARRNDLTRAVDADAEIADTLDRSARVSGKGSTSRRRTVVGVSTEGEQIVREVDESLCQRGRVLAAIGSTQCRVQAEDGRIVTCTVRRVVRMLAREARNAVVAGDRVLFQPGDQDTGVIERVEPRTGILSRGHKYREHILVANISQVMIVASAGDPPLKPALIDRFLVSAGKGGVAGVVCINKCDLLDPADLQPLVGLYARLGYAVVPTSATTGWGMESLRRLLVGRETVFTGQSGVGKSSLLNTIEPGLALRTGEISQVTQKGRHTTRFAELRELSFGGWVVDTPGIRQLELWDVHPAEVEGYFVEFRPFVPHCRFPDCLHLHEDGCAVKQAVRQQMISETRYENYLRIVTGDT